MLRLNKNDGVMKMSKIDKVSIYKLYAIEIYEMVKSVIPKYRHKFSPKRYTYWQMLSASIYGRTQEMKYRDIVEHLLISDSIRKVFEFEEVPSHKSLWEAFDATDEKILNELFEKSIEKFN